MSAFEGGASSKYLHMSVWLAMSCISFSVFVSSLMQSLLEPSPHDIVCVDRTATAAVLALAKIESGFVWQR